MNLRRITQNSPEHIAAISAGLARAREKARAGEGFIYVCAIENSDAIKIGHSLDPEFRAKRHGPSVRLLGFFPATIASERALHRLLKPHRCSGWAAREIYPRSVLVHSAELRAAA